MSEFDRRSLLEFSALGAGLGLFPARAQAAVTAGGYNDAPDQWIIDDTSAVADTDSGKVMGYVRGGVRIFKGVPYAEVLSPQGRWMRATKVRPWAGKRSCRAPGLICPPDTPPPGDANATKQTRDETLARDSDYLPTRPGENCLNVNIWTPGLDNKKRPVMFWLHGGGTHNGSAMMASRYEAHNLAKYGDVVVVTANHRMNAFGFLDLTAYGAHYAESANLGMLDVVDALKWMRTNIGNFGGDPDKVMVFGHSAGGGQILTLISMPESKGLLARAAVHSSSPWPPATPQMSQAVTASFLKLVNVSPNNIDALHKLSVEDIVRAAGIIWAPYSEAMLRYDKWSTPAAQGGWRAVVDGHTVPYLPTQPTEAHVPLIIGSTLHENFGALDHPEYAQMKEAEARQLTRVFFGPVGDGIYDVYKGIFPKAPPYEISAIARAMGNMRASAVKIAQRRSALANAAPTYNFWFQWRAGTFEGRAMSHHEIDMPMVFMTSDAIANVTGGTAAARAMSLKMADAWLAFAHGGDPNTKALPKWNPVTPKAMNTLVLDNTCRIDQGSDIAAIDMFWKDRFPKA